MTLLDDHIYVDEAVSGSLRQRPGLQALEKAMEEKAFDAVAVDDLSRLSRSNHQMLTMVMKFNYHQVKIISVSDGIISDDDNAKMGIHIRGFINELYLDDLKKKTMRGLEGQKLRGFSAGESVYGYCTKPVGELKINKKGQTKHEGKVHRINPGEAEIIRRIFKEFVGGKSLYSIVRSLNEDQILTKQNRPGGWNTSTISRILKNQKYIGVWDWRKYKNARDPMTGRIKKILRPKQEQLSIFREDLIIVDEKLWKKTQKRHEEIKGAWPVPKKKQPHCNQKSYIHTQPKHLFSGLMVCKTCGGAIVLITGKGSGYYGCYNAKRKTCTNTLKISRKKIEEIIIKDLREKILTTENLTYVYKNVEKLASRSFNAVPEVVKKKKIQHEKLLSEIQNYLNFIKSGNLSKAVSEALGEAEEKSENLKQEMASLKYQKQNTFKAPPKEWINHRLDRLRETLKKSTTSSALALKALLGPIALEPVMEEEFDPKEIIGDLDPGYPAPDSVQGSGITMSFKPYYVAHTKIRTLALLDEGHKGTNWLQWRRK